MEMKTYKVLITETLQRAVIVEAKSEREAHDRAEDAWKNTEVILDAEDFQGVEIFVLGESKDETCERLDRKKV